MSKIPLSTLQRGGVIALMLVLPAGAAEAQSVSLNLAQAGSQSFATNVLGILALTSVLAIAPGLLMIGTSFTRIVIVLSLLRTALGLQQTPPNSVIIALALILTGTIMGPSFEAAYDNGLQPLINGTITEDQAMDRGVKPFRSFMEANTSDKDLALFIDLTGWKPAQNAATAAVADKDEVAPLPSLHPAKAGIVPKATRASVPLHILCSAFVISELSKAFQIGFLLFLPFLVIDMAVSAILMGMGMMMLPPVVVSLPFKLIFFVLVSGWELVAGSLVRSFAG